MPTASYGGINIGKRHDTAASVNYFPGKIDDVRIYNRALSAGEVLSIYTNPFGLVLPPKNILLPYATSGTPTLSSPGFTSITSSAMTPQVIWTF